MRRPKKKQERKRVVLTLTPGWYSDGRFVMLKQPDNIYGQIDVPNTIPEMIHVVTNDQGIVVPFSDRLARSGEPVFLQDLQAVGEPIPLRIAIKWKFSPVFDKSQFHFETVFFTPVGSGAETAYEVIASPDGSEVVEEDAEET